VKWRNSAIQVSHLLTVKKVIMHLRTINEVTRTLWTINEKLLGCWPCIWVTSCRCGLYFCFRETYCLHLHGRTVNL